MWRRNKDAVWNKRDREEESDRLWLPKERKRDQAANQRQERTERKERKRGSRNRRAKGTNPLEEKRSSRQKMAEIGGPQEKAKAKGPNRARERLDRSRVER